MHYLYILFSISLDRFYVGYSLDPLKRLEQHLNYNDSHFTAKAKDWEIKAVFEISFSLAQAREIETFIKKQKSRKLIQQLVDPAFIPSGKLAILKSDTNLLFAKTSKTLDFWRILTFTPQTKHPFPSGY